MWALWTALALLACSPAARQQVVLEVATLGTPAGLEIEARATWLGQERTARLVDDGTGPDRRAHDGTWTAAWSGEPVRLLPVQLQVRMTGQPPVEAYAGLEPLVLGVNRLAWDLSFAEGPNARRVSRPLPIRGMAAHEMQTVLRATTWACLVLGLVLLLLRPPTRAPGRPPRSWPAWTSPLACLLLAVAWTWPAAREALAPHPAVVGRGFDALGTTWTLSAAPRLVPGFRDAATSWPAVADYRRLDSFTLVPIAILGQALHPARLFALLEVLGVAASAWAAEAFARALGARRPLSFLAALAFACGGLAATALLEGHAYHLLDPWLPLFAWSWWRATRADGRLRHGAAAGLTFALAVLTTGYLGLAAALVAIGLGVEAVVRRQLRPAPALTAAALVAAFGLVYLPLFVAGRPVAPAVPDPGQLQFTSASLAGLAGPTEELDRAAHGFAPTVGATLLALAVLSPFALPRGRRHAGVLLTGLAALVLAMGPRLSAQPPGGLFPLPMALVLRLPLLEVLRFPARLGWAWALCGGAVAAAAATELARRRPIAAPLLLGAALVDAFLVNAMPARQGAQPGGLPTAYAAAGGPVFDLMPEGLDPGGDLDAWLTAIACYHQAGHGHPIADDCVAAPVRASPRVRLTRWFHRRLEDGDPAGLEADLAAMGFRAVAFHPDLFAEGDRRRLASVLDRIDPDPVVSRDGGDHVRLHRIAGPPARDPAAAYERILDPAAARRPPGDGA